jgi:acetolactate synthase-1/2/3 large subunit
MKMTGAECLLRTLLRNGVNVCFMNPGTSEMQFVSALDRVNGMRPVLGLFEGVCSGAADGYARMTGKPAATLLHLGPGLGNALANFHNARKARSPVVNIVGDHSTAHKTFDAPLSADVPAFARTVSDWVRIAGSSAEIGSLTSQTIAAAMGPPGQVATLIVPADFSWSEAGELGPPLNIAPRAKPSSADVREVTHLLRKLGPASGVLIGGDTLNDTGLKAAQRIAAGSEARIFSDRNASRSALGGGRFQPERVAYFPERAEAQLASLKHIVLIEAKAPVSFFAYPGRKSTMLPDDCAITVLARPGDDGTCALQMLADSFDAVPEEKPSWQSGGLIATDDALTTQALGRVIAALLPEDAIICDEMVSSAEAVVPQLSGAARHDFLPVTGGSIGQGLPVAVGAAVACPNRKVIALEADGSGMYTLQALWTMARENLNVTVVIFSNRRYRILDVEMQRTGSQGVGPLANNMIDIGRPTLDWVKLAEGSGVEAVRANTTRQFATCLQEALKTNSPRLIEAVL